MISKTLPIHTEIVGKLYRRTSFRSARKNLAEEKVRSLAKEYLKDAVVIQHEETGYYHIYIQVEEVDDKGTANGEGLSPEIRGGNKRETDNAAIQPSEA